MTSFGNTFVLWNLDFGPFTCTRSERPGIFLENREGDNSTTCCVDKITLWLSLLILFLGYLWWQYRLFFFFPLPSRLCLLSLVKQITNICNGCALHHSQVSSHYNFNRKMQKYSNFKYWSSTFQWNDHFLHTFCFISSIPTDERFLRNKTRSIYQCQSIQELSSRKNAFNVHLLQRCAFCSQLMICKWKKKRLYSIFYN